MEDILHWRSITKWINDKCQEAIRIKNISNTKLYKFQLIDRNTMIIFSKIYLDI